MQAVTSDDYFLQSAANISFFLEEKAFDQAGKLKQAKGLSINKIGHGVQTGVHLLTEPCCNCPPGDPAPILPLSALLMPPPYLKPCMMWIRSSEPSPAPRRLRTCCAAWAIRGHCRYSPCTSSRWGFPLLCEWGRKLISHSLSTLVLRPHTSCLQQPNIGGEVVPHQDSTFIYTKPLSCIGLWWALEDADRSNGCLWAAPEEHRKGLRRRFFVKDGECAVHHDCRSWLAGPRGVFGADILFMCWRRGAE